MSKQTMLRRQAARLAVQGGERHRLYCCLASLRSRDLTPSTPSTAIAKIHTRRSVHYDQTIWSQGGNPRTAHYYYLSSSVEDSTTSFSIRWFSSSEEGKAPKAEEAEQKQPKEQKQHKKKERRPIPDKYEEPEDCPTWQNPLHHNDPDNQKLYEEDYGPDEEMVYAELPPFADPNDPEKILASQEIYDLADEIVNLSMLEMKELTTKIANHFGFEEPPFTGPGGGGGGAGGGDEGEDGQEEAAAAKTAFDLKLVSFDAKSKIKVIKEVRAVAGLGLKEAKEMVEGAPKVVMKDINKEMAEELKEKLEAVGAEIEIV